MTNQPPPHSKQTASPISGYGEKKIAVCWKDSTKYTKYTWAKQFRNFKQTNLREVGRGGGDWMELAQDRDRWRALVGTVRNLRVPKMREIS